MLKNMHTAFNSRLKFVCLVFVDGIYKKEISNPGVLSSYIDLNNNVFYLNIPSGNNSLIRIFNIRTGYQTSCVENASFKLIKCNPNAAVTILETFHGFDRFVYHNRCMMKVELEENSNATIYNIIDEGDKGLHTGNLLVSQKNNSFLETYRLAFRGDILSDSVVSTLLGEKSVFKSMGLYISAKKEGRMMSSKAHHMSSNTKSNQFYNGVADDYSASSFVGEIFIDSKIQNIEGHQKNKNLMLSENCSMSSHPDLRIDSDSVKCSHGATVGQVDEESIFYMKSRGIDQKLARIILVESFKNSIINNIPNRCMRQHICELAQR